MMTIKIKISLPMKANFQTNGFENGPPMGKVQISTGLSSANVLLFAIIIKISTNA